MRWSYPLSLGLQAEELVNYNSYPSPIKTVLGIELSRWGVDIFQVFASSHYGIRIWDFYPQTIWE